MNINGGLSPDNASLAADQIRNEHNTAETEEATITLSEHERILKQRVNEMQHERERERDATYNREIAVKQAQKLYTGRLTAPETVVSAAEKLYGFLSGEAKQPVGLTVNEDGSLINWNGENYVRQSESQKNYRVGAEDRQRLVLRRVRELLIDAALEYHPNQQVTVQQARDRVISILDEANWEF